MAEMRRQVAAHRPVGIDRLCFSKVDEAGVFAPLAVIAAESDLPVSWITTGRRIPEDLVDADRDLLVALATRRRATPGRDPEAAPGARVTSCPSDKERR
ncbi:MAG: hypothetical protein D6739_08950 [Nitrospirae bacterium]|nr:MAG: hypothetical protein D6739_08950 [Nitrospirota bacterium]